VKKRDVSAYTVTVSFCCSNLHESGTRNALLGSWLNNTEVYLTPFISTQNHTIAGWINKIVIPSCVEVKGTDNFSCK
jgi:hypothetical protein